MFSRTCAWTSTPGMRGSTGVVFEVEQADGGCSDQHQPLRDAIGRHPSFEHVDGGYIARLVVRREMDPELAVAVGRDHEAGHGRTLHAGVIGADQDGVAAADDAQHFQRQRRHDCALRLHHDRHAPHDAVAFGADREKPAAAGGLLERGHIAQQAGKIEKKWPRVAAHGRNADRRLGPPGCGHRKRKARFAKHDTRFSKCIGKYRIVARQRAQLCPRRLVKVAERVRGDARRHPVGLCENDVERHHQCAHLSEAGNKSAMRVRGQGH